jgi:Fic family protein
MCNKIERTKVVPVASYSFEPEPCRRHLSRDPIEISTGGLSLTTPFFAGGRMMNLVGILNTAESIRSSSNYTTLADFIIRFMHFSEKLFGSRK